MPDERAARGNSPGRAERRRVLSQNFLIDRRVIESLVSGSGVAQGDLVLDIGAGNGLITEALRARGARVIAVERDAGLARRLRGRFGPETGVEVVEGDVLAMPLPGEPFRVVANIPFGITTKILRRLLGQPGGTLLRADVIVQAEVARKRGTRGRGTLLNACWEPWFEFGTGPGIPAAAFRPRPRVDAAVLIVVRRDEPLLDPALRGEYGEFVTAAFTGPGLTVASALAGTVPRARFAGLAAELGFGLGAAAPQLEVGQWVGLFRATRRAGVSRAGGSRGGAPRAGGSRGGAGRRWGRG
jgi:23S rRNA (adenine-N6)-dimethyltransferase